MAYVFLCALRRSGLAGTHGFDTIFIKQIRGLCCIRHPKIRPLAQNAGEVSLT